MRKIQYMEIKYNTVKRASIETTLAKNLYSLFNRPPIIDSLRNIVGLALENMFYFIDFSKGKPFAKEAKNLTVFKRFPVRIRPPQRVASIEEAANRSKLLTIFESKNSWSASDCSDLIRLLAAIIEDQANLKYQEDNVKDFDRFKPAHTFKKVPEGLDSAKKIPNIGAKKNIRWRGKVDIKKSFDTGKIEKEEPLYKAAPVYITLGRKQIDMERMVIKAKAGERSSAFWGISGVRLMPASTVRKINIAFGLPEGCDISGTTSDSILMVNRVISFFEEVGENVAGEKVPVAVLQLLPLVTMVSLGHHTLFESACTLTLCGFINYSIGFYSTLLPQGQPAKQHDTAVHGKIKGYLAKAEGNSNDAHFLCFSGNGAYHAYLCDKESEIRKFKEMAKADSNLLNFFNTVSPQVTKNDIQNFFKRHNWNLTGIR